MKKISYPLVALTLLFALAVPGLADTIRLKDGSVIHGQVVGFKDGQFTILVGGTKGRKGRTTVYAEDVESIEFDATTGNAGGSNNTGSDDPTARVPSDPAAQPARPSPTPETTDSTPEPVSTQPTSAAPTFFTVKVTVRADNTNNGWTNSGLVVRRGQRLRITATGRVDLGRKGYATPTGLPTVNDNDKLMRTEPTGGLIGVIGDDNDEFVFIGSRREFVAQRDGVLFLGVNEGDLADNKGSYDVVIEAEAGSAPR